MTKRIFLAAGGIVFLLILFLFGKTTTTKPDLPQAQQVTPAFNVVDAISKQKQQLTPSQLIYVSKLENDITRGDVKTQSKEQLNQLADFWKDSARVFFPYAYYLSEAAKLDNSEKNLTFAAQLFLENLRQEHDEAKLNWETSEAIELFERALKLDPENDDLKIGLGSCYIYGKGRSGDPQETMKGIQQLLAVVRKDSTNMKAQFVLGVGGAVSGQYDKAIERLNKVVEAQPGNLEAIVFLADTYAASGNKAEAVKWYNISKRMKNDPLFTKEVDERMKSLQ